MILKVGIEIFIREAKEFYYDLGHYKYTVKVPKGYVVWGTGMLQNAKSVLSEPIYKKYLQAQSSDSIISIIDVNDYKSKTPDNTR